jgi:hypothetical protein
MALADIRARDPDLGTQGLEMQNLLLAHLVGDDEDEAIALLRRDKRKAEPGIAGRRLDQGAARADLAVALGRLDQRQADAVLDRAGGILVLELDEERATAGVEARQLHERRVADRIEDAPMHRHDAPPAAAPFLRLVAGPEQGRRKVFAGC